MADKDLTAPDHWQSLSREKRLEMEKYARGLVRGSIIEDASSRFMAMCMAEAIGESKRRADLCDPMQDERVRRLAEASARLAYVARQNTDDVLEWERVCEDVRAALRDLEQP